MKKFLTILSATLFSAVLMVGCAKAPTMNASSEAKYKSSIEEMSKDMSDSQKQEFVEACEKLRKYHTEQMMKKMRNNPKEAQAMGLAALDDKTADEIIKESKNL